MTGPELRDAGEHVSEPGTGIEVIQLRGDDQRVYCRRPFAVAIGSREQPGFPAEGDATQSSFRGVIREANTAITEKERGRGAAQHSGRAREAPGSGCLTARLGETEPDQEQKR